jgi:hypothetical protein
MLRFGSEAVPLEIPEAALPVAALVAVDQTQKGGRLKRLKEEDSGVARVIHVASSALRGQAVEQPVEHCPPLGRQIGPDRRAVEPPRQLPQPFRRSVGEHPRRLRGAEPTLEHSAARRNPHPAARRDHVRGSQTLRKRVFTRLRDAHEQQNLRAQ